MVLRTGYLARRVVDHGRVGFGNRRLRPRPPRPDRRSVPGAGTAARIPAARVDEAASPGGRPGRSAMIPWDFERSANARTAPPRERWPRWAAPAAITAVVLAVSRAWTEGALVTDGPGISLYVRLAMRHLAEGWTVPYLVPELWAGTPAWALAPSVQVFLLVPLGWVLGADPAVKAAILATQVLGGWGAYVLARSLWDRVPAALVAGVLYALHPMFVSHGALAGSEPTVAVMAIAPWLVWALRRGLRGDGRRYVVGAGLLAGFAVLNQAEVALGLALLCACQLGLELARAARGLSPAGAGDLLRRSGAVVVTGLGICAFWLLPLQALGDWFILSPPDLVQGELVHGTSARISRELGVLFTRPPSLAGVVSFDRTGLFPHFFYLSWVCVALSLLTTAVLARRRDADDGTLTAVLVASAVSVWLSTGAIPLASSAPVARSQYVPMVLLGAATGLLAVAVVRRLSRTGDAPRRPLVVGAVLVVLVVVPYLAPFADLQKVLPLLDTLRFPRFYTVAALGMALGGAFPLALVQRWAEDRNRRLAAGFTATVALALVGLFVVDVAPYRNLYRIRPPATARAYAAAVDALEEVDGEFRVATGRVEPAAAVPLLDAGLELSNGWPHPIAGRQLWRLTTETFVTPEQYRQRALGLSGTRWLALERTTGKGTPAERIEAVDLVANPQALPLVRAYRHTVALQSGEVAPELAVGLAYRGVGVVTADSEAARAALGATAAAEVPSDRPCTDGTLGSLNPGLAGPIAVACAMHPWLTTAMAGVSLLNVSPGVGGVMEAQLGRLQGVAVYLDRPPGRAELTLHELGDDGLTLGRTVARTLAVGTDEHGLTAFVFDPIVGSAGRRYAFVVACPRCAPELVPRMVATRAVDAPGTLIEAGQLVPGRVAAYAPIYDPVDPIPASTTTVRHTRPGAGRWRLETQGNEPALVVVATTYFPGWQARIDGRPVPVVEADGAFVGIPVPAGSHVVTLAFHRPGAAGAGRVITGATLLAVAVMALRRVRRGRAPRPPKRPGAPTPPRRPPPPSPPDLPPLLAARPRTGPRASVPDNDDWDRVVEGGSR